MTDLLVSDSDRDALIGAGLLLGAAQGVTTVRVVASLPEVSRLLHDLRRSYTRIVVCGVPAADSGSLRSALTVLQARGVKVLWFDSHDLLWTTEVRSQLDYLGVETHLPDPNRPETERVGGLVLAHLHDSGNPRASSQARQLWASVAEVRRHEMGGPDWLALVDAVEHDHRLVTNRAIRSAMLRIWDPDAPLDDTERRLVALQRSRETRVERFLERIARDAQPYQQLLSFDAEAYREVRHVRARMYVEAARRRLGAEYAQARVEQGWLFACRDPFRPGIDLPIAFLERFPDVDVSVHGYPYRVTVRVHGGVNVDERLMKAVEVALEEDRTGRRQPMAFPIWDEELD